jgi:hypothetical protein
MSTVTSSPVSGKQLETRAGLWPSVAVVADSMSSWRSFGTAAVTRQGSGANPGSHVSDFI